MDCRVRKKSMWAKHDFFCKFETGYEISHYFTF